MSAMKDIDQAMADLQRQVGAKTNPPKRRAEAEDRTSKRPVQRWVRRWIGTPLFVLLVPFAVLLRGSTALYTETTWPVWLCVFAAAIGATGLLVGGVWWIARRFRWKVSGLVVRALFLVVMAFAGYTTLYVSVDNVKAGDIKTTYSSLHPLLRLSSGSLFLIDSSSVITDTGRTPEDYAQMGLPVNESSLHFEQADGYVHALDLRTQGRAAWKNTATTWWYRALGFRTLRHTGTADHLHISLPVR